MKNVALSVPRVVGREGITAESSQISIRESTLRWSGVRRIYGACTSQCHSSGEPLLVGRMAGAGQLLSIAKRASSWQILLDRRSCRLRERSNQRSRWS